MSDDTFHKLHKFLSEASEDNKKSISVFPCDDGLSDPGPSSNASGDDYRQPELEVSHAVQASKSEPNFDDKGKRRVLNPRMPEASSPATPVHWGTKHRKEHWSLFRQLLSHCGDSKATVLSAGDLYEMLGRLGMSPEVTKDDLRHKLKTSRYADESGLLDFEYFSFFAEEFELLESLLAYSASQQKGGEYSERGPLRDFFNALAVSHRDARQLKECDVCFKKLLSHRGDPIATVLGAGDLCEMLKKLGMPPKVTEDELQGLLTLSEYADGNGTLDFERFMIFAGDFLLLESLRAFKASQQKGGEYVERGPLRDLFNALAASHRDANHRRKCNVCFKQLLSHCGDPTATVLRAGDLSEMLMKLGMPPMITEDVLQGILTLSDYTDGNGTLNFERFMIFAEDFKLLESLRAYKSSQLIGGEYVERGPLGEVFKIFESGGLQPGFPGSSSNNGGKRKQPIIEPPVLPISSTSPAPIYTVGDIMYRKECKSCFSRLLSRHGDPNAATTLRAGALCGILKKLGMAPEVTDDELGDMLKFSGYADEDGTLDFERFTIFAKDFVLLESLRVLKALQLHDQGPLGDFFGILKSGEDLGFSDDDFSVAFERLGVKLKGGTANILARYANLHPGINITFEQFARVLREEQERHMQRTGQTMSSRSQVSLDKGHRLGRLMAFVSSYTRSDRALRKVIRMLRNNDTKREPVM